MRILHIVGLVMVIVSFNSCKKVPRDIQDYYPKVKIVSAIVQDDGSVLVQGEVESSGQSEIQNVGFCCDTKSKPKLESRQMEVRDGGYSFSAVYKNLSYDSTYYIAAWATNEYGYTIGNTIELSGIKPAAAPCTYTLNTLDVGAGLGSEPNFNMFIDPIQFSGEWRLIGGSSYGNVSMKFGGDIKTKIYVTNINSTPNDGQVFVSFSGSHGNGVLNYGSNVYVFKLPSGAYDITICSAPWTVSTMTWTAATRFTVGP